MRPAVWRATHSWYATHYWYLWQLYFDRALLFVHSLHSAHLFFHSAQPTVMKEAHEMAAVPRAVPRARWAHLFLDWAHPRLMKVAHAMSVMKVPHPMPAPARDLPRFPLPGEKRAGRSPTKVLPGAVCWSPAAVCVCVRARGHVHAYGR